jgi:hypothetical protein
VGGEFVVDGGASAESYYGNVAIAPHGTFVVVWTRDVLTGDANVYGRLFDASANALGPAFRVHADTTGIQTGPRVAMDRLGGFVVTWQDRDGRDGDGHGVFAQRFGPAGQRLGAEFRVNTSTAGHQYAYSVARAPDGRFIVAWDGQTPSGRFGIFAQRFDASGAPLGNETSFGDPGKVSFGAVAVDHQFQADFSMQSTVVDGNGFGIGWPGWPGPVNTFTSFSQQAANIAMDEAGNFLITWHSDRQDGSDLGIFAQRYRGGHPKGVRVNPTGNGVIEPGEVAAVQPTWTNLSSMTWFPWANGLIVGTPEGPPGGAPQVLTTAAAYEAPLGASVECDPCPTVQFPDPSPRPALHWDGAVTERFSYWLIGNLHKRWVLHVGESFGDVPPTSPFYRFVETLLHHGVTGGCTATSYCPASVAARDQMSVFVLAAKEGPGYAPPACGTPMFADVPGSSPFCRWIEELARRGVVAGCGGGNFCPGSPVSRQEMAVFALRTAEPTRTPPPCAAPAAFADVPASSPFCRWIEELARRGVVSGCGGGNYCPLGAVTREQMAVFIGGTFALALYGL